MKLHLFRFVTPTPLYWFERGPQDDRYLDLWATVPRHPEPTDVTGWHTDHYEEPIAHDETGRRFERAADLLLRYQFYPPTVMRYVSTFGREGRRMRVGDHIVQRVHVFRPFGLPIIDVLTLNEVTAVIDEPRRKGFTYVTTETHSEEGHWSAEVEWRPDNIIVLTVHAVSRPSPQENPLLHPLMRGLQKRAHHLGIEAFRHAVLEDTIKR